MPELQRLCPLCLTADQHAPGCLLENKAHVYVEGSVERDVDWPATLKKYGIHPQATAGLKIVGEIASMSLKPGDVVVVQVIGGIVSPEALERLHNSVKPHFPNNDVLVANDGVEITIFSPEQEDAT